jgi:NAD-dependent DNA ligase
LTNDVEPQIVENRSGAAYADECESIILHMRSGSIFSYTSDSLDIFKGKRFVITEHLESPEDSKDVIEECGGTVVNTISGNVDYLVCRDLKTASEETQKAMELNIPIITEDEINMIIYILNL